MLIKYIGHSSFLIKEDGLKILTDPFISGNPNIDLNPLSLDVDIILLTHDHGDHIGDTIDIAKNTGATVITIFDLANYLSKFKIETIGGNIGGTIECKGKKFTFTKAEHSCEKGSPVGFIIYLNNKNIYFAGDTGPFLDMKLIKDLYSPEISILPIDGFFNMGVKEAVYALKLLDSKTVIPMHHSTFPKLKYTPSDFKKEIENNNLEVKMLDLSLGEEIEM